MCLAAGERQEHPADLRHTEALPFEGSRVGSETTRPPRLDRSLRRRHCGEGVILRHASPQQRTVSAFRRTCWYQASLRVCPSLDDRPRATKRSRLPAIDAMLAAKCPPATPRTFHIGVDKRFLDVPLIHIRVSAT